MSESDLPQVVYALGEDCKPAHFLELVAPDEDVDAVCEKWARAFVTGKKEQPGEYRGISHRPIVGYHLWPDGEERESE